MHAVIRKYTGASNLMSEMGRKQPEIENLIETVPGFIAYYAVRDGDGLTTVTVCDDRRGTDESTRRAREWVKENIATANMTPPQVTSGDVFVHFGVPARTP